MYYETVQCWIFPESQGSHTYFFRVPSRVKFWWFIFRGYMKPQIFKAQCMPRFVINCLKITMQTHPKIWAGLP